MKKRILRYGALALVVGGLVLGLAAPAAFAETTDRRGGPGAQWSNQAAASWGGAWGVAQPGEPLDEAEQAALERAVLEEYGALNLYNAVMDQFGGVLPFSRIARSESQHVSVLIQAADRYGVDVPENPGLDEVPVFDTLADACQAGVDAEIADAALYDELLQVTDNPDLVQVYGNLQAASLNNHLPAFEACN